jgi:N-acetylmuramoyl-L-alanine amidase
VAALRTRRTVAAFAALLLTAAAPAPLPAATPADPLRCTGPQVPRRPFTALHRLLIDPGHGGGDPGTIGVAEIAEKHIALLISKRLRDRLREVDPALDVRLTRSDDIDLSLQDRAHLANLWSPELFLSLHLNAAPNPEAQGIETLTLAPVGTVPGDPVPGREVEGACSVAAEVGVVGDDTAVVIDDLRRAAATNLSLVAAELMQQSAISATGAFDREVKQGRFRVLRGLYMPGIVVEMGFLSHPSEGRLIPLPAWQACTVEALIDGLLRIDATLAKGDYPVASPDASRPLPAAEPAAAPSLPPATAPPAPNPPPIRAAPTQDLP